jgi:hypothetical protein
LALFDRFICAAHLARRNIHSDPPAPSDRQSTISALPTITLRDKPPTLTR